MEVASQTIKEKFRSIFLKEKIPFAQKADVNWKIVTKCLLTSVGISLLILLFMPNQKQQETSFHETAKPGSQPLPNQIAESQDPTAQTLAQMNSRGFAESRGGFGNQAAGGSANGSGSDRSASMILTRTGQDSKTQMPAGSRISVRLLQSVTVATTAMPVIGVVTRDFVQEDQLAIPTGSKLFGQASFDAGSERAKIDWQSVQLADGRARQFSAVSVGSDGQLGVEGNVHSNAVRNTLGATLTKFIGAYAEGSMERGAFGGNPGGSDNGWKDAIAETAKDKASALADDLKTQKQWIEISPSTEFYAVLSSSFTFRDPGATYGR